jgi:hypothetical protein
MFRRHRVFTWLLFDKPHNARILQNPVGAALSREAGVYPQINGVNDVPLPKMMPPGIEVRGA